jgi:ATP-dependent helicase/nuclease subunit B
MTPFAEPGPRWFSIPAHRPFLDDLAAGLYAALAPVGPDALADATVLVPNRRAARALSQAFVKAAGGRALVLPQIRALGDLDEGEPPFEPGDIALNLPPAISRWRRRFELAALAAGHAPQLRRTLDAAAAMELGDALGGFFDSLEIEEIGAVERDRIATLVEGDLAEHWQVSARFLDLVIRDWPERLAALGLMDVTARRVALLKALEENWRDYPPAHPVIAAGSTGSAPATARLLDRVARLDQGCVVLPGLDEGLSDQAWAQVAGDAGEQHPQGALRRLLTTAGIDRRDVKPWLPAPDTLGRLRRRVINEALRPAEATADWRAQIAELRRDAPDGADPIAAGLQGLTSLAAHNEEEAAGMAAVLLREVLETPGKTCALITPDQALARRICAKLSRWDISVDSSAGLPLAEHPVGVLLSLTAHALAEPDDPVTQLALLKHPLIRLGRDAETLAGAAGPLERYGLRGPRPRDAAALGERLEKHPHAQALADDLRAILSSPSCDPISPASAARALAESLEALAAGPGGGTGGLWAGAAGGAAADLLSALIEDGQTLPAATPAAFAVLIDRLLAQEVVRAAGAAHPRLQILGALEGRLIQADRLVLAGLEEGVWPPAAPTDPFLSRPMRKTIGLPSPERRIGLSAHDFAQAACAPEVILLHTERQGGQPAVKSRWLWRLETLAAGAGLTLGDRPEIARWAQTLNAPGPLATAKRPRPTPPVAVRPKGLSATRIERWIRDPYAIYAQYILGLRPLDAPDTPIGPRERGTAIHAAMERLAKDYPGDLPEDAEAVIGQAIVDALEEAGLSEARLVRERALAANLAPWLAAFEDRRRPGARRLVEQKGVLNLLVDGEPFELAATADRIDLRGSQGDVLDFKTGHAPTGKQVKSHLAPQLTLTAAILEAGGFADAGPTAAGELVYVRLNGGRVQGEESIVAEPGDSSGLAAEVLSRLTSRIAAFRDPSTPYISRAIPQFQGETGDYDHLARLLEWSIADGGDDAP